MKLEKMVSAIWVIVLSAGMGVSPTKADEMTQTPTATPGIDIKSLPDKVFGDGVHDDSSGVAAGVSYIGAHGGTLVFPPGTYLINSAELILSGSNFELQGTPGSTIFLTSALTQLVDVKQLSGVTVTGLTFKATTADPDDGHGVRALIYANSVPVSNLSFENCSFSCPSADMDGLSFVAHSNSASQFCDIRFSNCDFEQIGRIGVEIHNTSQPKTACGILNMGFEGCRFNGCGVLDPRFGQGISGSGGPFDSGLTISNCDFENVKMTAIEAMFNHVVIDGNKFSKAFTDKTDPINITPKNFGGEKFGDIQITNNNASDSTYSGNKIWDCNSVVLKGNVWVTDRNCLFLRGVSGLVATGDTYDTSGSTAIFGDRPSSSLVFTGCAITNRRGGDRRGALVVCETEGDSDLTFDGCTLTSVGKLYGLMTRLRSIGSTGNGQALGN